MPIHDWTRVGAGTFHDFHGRWITHLVETLNDGLLPESYYAQSEQVAGELISDALTFREVNGTTGSSPLEEAGNPGAVCLLTTTSPRVRLTMSADDGWAVARRRAVIRHTSDDRMVALLEIVSPGNKSSRNALRQFVNKTLNALNAGLSLLIVDLFPPGPRDPAGIHGAVWEEIDDKNPYAPPPDGPLTLVAYRARPTLTAYIEPTTLGRELIDMPLFLDADVYVNVPLERTYQSAWRVMPRKYRAILERPATQG